MIETARIESTLDGFDQTVGVDRILCCVAAKLTAEVDRQT